MGQKNFETTGTIVKEEKLSNVDYKIIPNTLVLEIIQPFPGYHHELPEFTSPGSIFLITRYPMSREIIARLTKKIRRVFPYPFDAAAAIIDIRGYLHGIRIKKLPSYEVIEDLQKCFKSEGIEFRKYKKIEENAVITVKKFFQLTEIEDELFIDQDERMAYFSVPEPIDWNTFKTITINIRNNWDFKDFDAAMGSMYFNSELWELVRIYWEKPDTEKLKALRQKYLNEISRVLQF